jgi:hypothetical protein
MMNIFLLRLPAQATKYFQTKFSPQLGVARWRLMTFDGAEISERKMKKIFFVVLLLFCRLLGGRGQRTRRVSSCETIQLIWNPWAWWRIGRRWDAPDAAPDHQPPARDR